MIPNGNSEAVNRSRKDNTMVKRKRSKGQTMIYKTLHRVLKIEQYEPHYKPWVPWVNSSVSNFYEPYYKPGVNSSVSNFYEPHYKPGVNSSVSNFYEPHYKPGVNSSVSNFYEPHYKPGVNSSVSNFYEPHYKPGVNSSVSNFYEPHYKPGVNSSVSNFYVLICILNRYLHYQSPYTYTNITFQQLLSLQ